MPARLKKTKKPVINHDYNKSSDPAQKELQRREMLQIIKVAFIKMINLLLLDTDDLDQTRFNKRNGFDTETTIFECNHAKFIAKKRAKKRYALNKVRLMSGPIGNVFIKLHHFNAIFLDYMGYFHGNKSTGIYPEQDIENMLKNSISDRIAFGIVLSGRSGGSSKKTDIPGVTKLIAAIITNAGFKIVSQKIHETYGNQSRMCARFYVLQRV